MQESKKAIVVVMLVLASFVMLTSCNKPSSEKKILDFRFYEPAVEATIMESAKTVIATVPAGTNVTALVPVITVSEKASVNPGSGIPQDFTHSKTYIVTAEDDTQAVYTVTVIIGNSGGDDGGDDGGGSGDGGDTQTYTITTTANPVEGGTVIGGGTYEAGVSDTLTAIANTNYTFDYWQDGDTTNPRIIMVTANANYVAYFISNGGGSGGEEPQLYNINVSANPADGGVVSGGGTYNHGTNCTVSAIANEGFTFTNWTENDSVVSSNASYSFIVTDNHNLCANFTVIPTYTITVTAIPTEGGDVAGGGTYMSGTSVTLTATANENYTFDHWQDNVTTNPRTITVTTSATYTACFTYNGGGNGNANGHAFVDLGLPSGTLWATCNIGADAPEDYGDYFAWGETETKGTYSWSTYKWCNGNNATLNRLTKYCSDSSFGENGFTDDLTVLLPEDDAATANWGGDWRMPTREEWDELLNNTTNTWTTQNGVCGWLFTATNGSSLFLPAAGYCWDNGLNYAGSYGNYWSSSLYTIHPNWAWRFYFESGDWRIVVLYRFNGSSVRAVLPASKK